MNPRRHTAIRAAALAPRLSVLLFAVMIASPLHAQATRRAGAASGWDDLAAGSRAVGYTLLDLRDPARTLLPDTLGDRSSPARVIPVRIWYPAASGEGRRGRPLIVGSVVAGRAGDPDSALEQRTLGLHRYAAQKYDRAGGGQLVVADTVGVAARALTSPISARAAVREASGRHPLLLFAGGTAHSVDENVALWESLASHGYVVAAIPTVAIEPRAEEAYLPDDGAGLETVTRDLELVLAHMSARPDIDTRRIAAAGFSFGGAAALALAARNTSVRAVVGFDPSFIAARHLAMLRANPLFDVRRIAVPLLEFHRADTTVDLSLVRSASRSARTSIELSGLDHVDFNSYVLLYGPLLRDGSVRPVRDSALVVKSAIYRAMVRTATSFLDRTLTPSDGGTAIDRAALSGTGPVWAAVPPRMLQVRQWPAGAAPGADSSD